MDRNILFLLILATCCEWSLAHDSCHIKGTNTSKFVDVEICVLVTVIGTIHQKVLKIN